MKNQSFLTSMLAMILFVQPILAAGPVENLGMPLASRAKVQTVFNQEALAMGAMWMQQVRETLAHGPLHAIREFSWDLLRSRRTYVYRIVPVAISLTVKNAFAQAYAGDPHWQLWHEHLGQVVGFLFFIVGPSLALAYGLAKNYEPGKKYEFRGVRSSMINALLLSELVALIPGFFVMVFIFVAFDVPGWVENYHMLGALGKTLEIAKFLVVPFVLSLAAISPWGRRAIYRRFHPPEIHVDINTPPSQDPKDDPDYKYGQNYGFVAFGLPLWATGIVLLASLINWKKVGAWFAANLSDRVQTAAPLPSLPHLQEINSAV